MIKSTNKGKQMCHFLTIILVLLSSFSRSDARVIDNHLACFDGLLVKATAIESDEFMPHKGHWHFVTVFVTIKNLGKLPACTPFTAELKTTQGSGFWQIKSLIGPPRSFPREPRVGEMLPGEQTNGGYVFKVKDGVELSELSLWLPRHSTRSGPGKECWLGASPQEIRLDVRELPAPSDPQNEGKSLAAYRAGPGSWTPGVGAADRGMP